MAQEVRLDLVAKVDKALKDIEALKDGIDASAKATEEAAKATEDSAKATKSASKATKALGKSFKGVGLAMKAAGIGLVMALFSKLKQVLEQNQTVMDLVSTAMNTISVVFNEVSDVVTDVYDSVTKSSEGFEGLGKVLSNVMTISLIPMKAAFYGIKAGILALMIAWEDSFLGGGDEGKIASLTESLNETKQSLLDIKDEGLDAVKNIGDNIAEAITEVVAAVTIIVDEGRKGLESIDVKAAFKTGGELTKLRNEVKLLDADAKGLMLTYQTQAELQRQIRDDESATIAQRVAANEELGRILDEQLEKETELAQKKVDLAQLESDLNADNIDLQIALKDAKTELIDINERIIGQESEQKTNQVSLNKELLESENELALIGKTSRELALIELEIWYEQKIELARKAGEDTAAIEEEFALKSKELTTSTREQTLESLSQLSSAFSALNASKITEIEEAQSKEVKGIEAAQKKEVDLAKKNGGDVQAINDRFQDIKDNLDAAAQKKKDKLAKRGQKIAAAQAIIDTYLGATKALATLPPPAGYIAAAATIVAGLANVKTIFAQDVGGGAGGGSVPSGGGVPSIGGNLASSIPAATGLGDVVNSVNAQGQQPVEAFVISQTVTDSQEAQSYINNQRTL
jgi:hypothetical protein